MGSLEDLESDPQLVYAEVAPVPSEELCQYTPVENLAQIASIALHNFVIVLCSSG